MTLLVITGLQREARIAAGDGVMTLCSGGDAVLLRERLSAFSRPHPEERAKPASFETAASQPPQDEGGDRLPFTGVLSFGLAGGLAPDLKPGDMVLATHVQAGDAHYDATFDWHDAITAKIAGAVQLHCGLIAGVDRVLSKSADKAALHAMSGALAVDMESHIAAAYAQRSGLPFAALRAIGDPAARSLPDIAANALTRDGNVDLPKVLAGVLKRPGQIPALIAAGIDSGRAFASLRCVRGLLGPLFGLGGTDFR
jgi:hopanoid-associated phosphorylase